MKTKTEKIKSQNSYIFLPAYDQSLFLKLGKISIFFLLPFYRMLLSSLVLLYFHDTNHHTFLRGCKVKPEEVLGRKNILELEGNLEINSLTEAKAQRES